jgi:hypothetical protein
MYVRPRLHDPNASTFEEKEKYVTWHSEMGVKLRRAGVETNTVIYDLEGFSVSNMVDDISLKFNNCF